MAVDLTVLGFTTHKTKLESFTKYSYENTSNQYMTIFIEADIATLYYNHDTYPLPSYTFDSILEVLVKANHPSAIVYQRKLKIDSLL